MHSAANKTRHADKSWELLIENNSIDNEDFGAERVSVCVCADWRSIKSAFYAKIFHLVNVSKQREPSWVSLKAFGEHF